TIAYRHGRYRAGFAGFELPHVGIHVDRYRSRGRRSAAGPMAPVRSRCATARATKPSLITEQHLALQGGRIHTLRMDRGVQEKSKRQRQQETHRASIRAGEASD